MKKRNFLALMLVVVLTLIMCVSIFAVTGIKSISISGKKTVYVGKTVELDSDIFPDYMDVEDRNIVWSSSNSKVAKVLQKNDDDTKIKGMKAGKATITVRVKGTKIKAVYKITVKKSKKSKGAFSKAKKTLYSYKNKAKTIKEDINKLVLAVSVTDRRQQYGAFERRISALEQKLERMDEQWEDKYDFGKISRKSYRAIENKIESIENYLDRIEEYLDEKFVYEFDD